MAERPQPSPAPAGVLEGLLQSYNRGAPDEAAELYAPDATHEDVAQGRRAIGADAIESGLATFLRCFPDAVWAVEQLLGDADGAAAAYRLTGTLQADLGPFRAAGQPLDLQGVMLVSVAAGKITSSRDFWDGATLGRQLGAAR
ncbi:MAG: hypothetical protein JWQ20_2289 [Conexibacter sp.]|jgi:steroid delta-isomerase-like uncharacterized protein|nr:hypothetical protein [Conexibacter sp.]